MVDLVAIRRLAGTLPEVEVHDTGQAYASIGGKGLCWAYMARDRPKTPRVELPGVVAVRCLMETRDMLLEAAPERFFTDDHYRGFPAVLARIDRIDEAEMEGILRGAWRVLAPKILRKRYPEV